MTNAQKRIIERELYNYKKNKAFAGDLTVDYAYGRLGVDYSKKTAQTNENGEEKGVVNAVEKDMVLRRRAWGWATVYEKTADKYRWEQKDKFIYKKYVEKKNPIQICRELHIEQRTYYYWQLEILNTACHWAQEIGVME